MNSLISEKLGTDELISSLEGRGYEMGEQKNHPLMRVILFIKALPAQAGKEDALAIARKVYAAEAAWSAHQVSAEEALTEMTR